MNWYDKSVVYQIYPLGLTGAPYDNDGIQEHRILQLLENGWIEHLQKLGVNCVILNPVFESETHGYDTINYGMVDVRLGTNEDLRAVVDAFHAAGMRVLLDGVFNHVGRSFWAFEDVRQNREASEYADWFCINWGGNNEYDDGFSYDTWAGVPYLVKLNHRNFDLNAYCADVIREWEQEYDIDGLRLDVAYCLDIGFLGYLRQVADELSEKRAEKFLLLGETMFGDYNLWMGDNLCDSVTNYECYKGLWSSMNASNMHEVAYALERQSGDKPWDLYTGKRLLNFVDNHDVPRIATRLENKKRLKLHVHITVLNLATRLGNILLCIFINRNYHFVVVAHILIGTASGRISIGRILFLHRLHTIEIYLLTTIEEPCLISLCTLGVTKFTTCLGTATISLFKIRIGFNNNRKITFRTFVITHRSSQQCTVKTCKSVIGINTQHHIKILDCLIVITKLHEQ
jgi:glycosidase